VQDCLFVIYLSISICYHLAINYLLIIYYYYSFIVHLIIYLLFINYNFAYVS